MYSFANINAISVSSVEMKTYQVSVILWFPQTCKTCEEKSDSQTVLLTPHEVSGQDGQNYERLSSGTSILSQTGI